MADYDAIRQQIAHALEGKKQGLYRSVIYSLTPTAGDKQEISAALGTMLKKGFVDRISSNGNTSGSLWKLTPAGKNFYLPDQERSDSVKQEPEQKPKTDPQASKDKQAVTPESKINNQLDAIQKKLTTPTHAPVIIENGHLKRTTLCRLVGILAGDIGDVLEDIIKDLEKMENPE